MKLLFFASDYKIGISSLLTDQIIALKKTGIDVFAIAGEKEQENGLYKKIKSNDVNISIINGLDEHSNFIALSKQIKNIIITNNITIVHVQNNWQLALISFVKYVLLCFNIKIIYTLHAFRHNHKLRSIVAQFCIGLALFLFADNVICMCNYLKKKFLFLSYKIILLPLGISDEYFTSFFVEPSIENGLQMVFPAQFRHGKNQDMIIRAFAKFIKKTEDTDSHLILPGSGPLLNDMKDLVKLLGISDRVSFPGQCTKLEIKDYYLKSNLAIVSSNSETFGQSIVEPFVLGRCVISRPVGIAPDIINSGNGFIFNNEDDLYKILIECSKSIKHLIDIGYKNYISNKNFSWQSISNKYISLILK